MELPAPPGLCYACSGYCCTQDLNSRSGSFAVKLTLCVCRALRLSQLFSGRAELDLFCCTSFNAGIAFHVERLTCIIMSPISFGLNVGICPGLCLPAKVLIATLTSVAVSCIICEVAASVQSFESVNSINFVIDQGVLDAVLVELRTHLCSLQEQISDLFLQVTTLPSDVAALRNTSCRSFGRK